MAGWDGLKTNVSQHTEDIHQETDTNKIQMKSTKEVKENFQSLNMYLLENNLTILKKKDPLIQRISEIPELHNLKLEKINIHNDCRAQINIITDFDGNLRQLLLKHGFNKNNLRSFNWEVEKIMEEVTGVPQTPEIWVHLSLYWWSLQLFIKQKNLSK